MPQKPDENLNYLTALQYIRLLTYVNKPQNIPFRGVGRERLIKSVSFHSKLYV